MCRFDQEILVSLRLKEWERLNILSDVPKKVFHMKDPLKEILHLLLIRFIFGFTSLDFENAVGYLCVTLLNFT